MFGIYGAAAAIAVLSFLRVLPVVCRRAAAATTEAAQPKKYPATPSPQRRRPRGDEAEPEAAEAENTELAAQEDEEAVKLPEA